MDPRKWREMAGLTAGSGVWESGDLRIQYEWSLTDTTAMDDRHERIGCVGPGVFALVRAKRLRRNGVEFRWIQYTCAIHEGRVYVPPPPAPPWPWEGVDTGARNDGLPYTNTPAVQARLDAGNARGWQGVVQDLYDIEDADSIFVDWAASGGMPEWGQFSVVGLIGTKGGRDWLIGATKFAYATNSEGEMGWYGGGGAEEGDIALWMKALRAGFGKYVNTVFVGGGNGGVD